MTISDAKTLRRRLLVVMFTVSVPMAVSTRDYVHPHPDNPLEEIGVDSAKTGQATLLEITAVGAKKMDTSGCEKNTGGTCITASCDEDRHSDAEGCGYYATYAKCLCPEDMCVVYGKVEGRPSDYGSCEKPSQSTSDEDATISNNSNDDLTHATQASESNATNEEVAPGGPGGAGGAVSAGGNAGGGSGTSEGGGGPGPPPNAGGGSGTSEGGGGPGVAPADPPKTVEAPPVSQPPDFTGTYVLEKVDGDAYGMAAELGVSWAKRQAAWAGSYGAGSVHVVVNQKCDTLYVTSSSTFFAAFTIEFTPGKGPHVLKNSQGQKYVLTPTWGGPENARIVSVMNKDSLLIDHIRYMEGDYMKLSSTISAKPKFNTLEIYKRQKEKNNLPMQLCADDTWLTKPGESELAVPVPTMPGKVACDKGDVDCEPGAQGGDDGEGGDVSANDVSRNKSAARSNGISLLFLSCIAFLRY